MNLQEICKDERFANGELFASCRNRYLLTNKEYGSVNWYDEFGVPIKINWSGFFITDFISDKWKFYQLIDGKMVEVEASPKRGSPTTVTQFNDTIREVLSNMSKEDWEKEAKEKGYSGDKAKAYVKKMYETFMADKQINEKENIAKMDKEFIKNKLTWSWYPGFSEEEVTNAEEEMTNIIGNMMWEVEEDNQSKAREEDSQKCQCLNGTRAAFVDGTCEICGKILQKIKSLIMNPEDYKILKNLYEEKIMQPTQEINLADFTLEKMTNGLKEYARNQTKDIQAFMNADGDLIDNPLYPKEEHIMQPTEAIRWMRENPGKVIVAVNDIDNIFRYKYSYHAASNRIYSCEYKIKSAGYEVWECFSGHSCADPLAFFAHTYIELKE